MCRNTGVWHRTGAGSLRKGTGMEVRGRRLHFGVHMQEQRTNWADYLSAVRAVEALGYGSIWTFDHLLPFSGDVDGPCFATLTTMGALAVATSSVQACLITYSSTASADPRAQGTRVAFADPTCASGQEYTLTAYMDGSILELFTSGGKCATVRRPSSLRPCIDRRLYDEGDFVVVLAARQAVPCAVDPRLTTKTVLTARRGISKLTSRRGGDRATEHGG